MEAKEQHRGHRKRIKERFLKSEPRAFDDYEILEMLLFNSFPRTDTKPLAKRLLKRFNSFKSVIFAEDSQLKEVEGVSESVLFNFRLMRDVCARLELDTNEKVHILGSWSSVLNYCRLTMGSENVESFRVLYLNKKNILIKEEVMQTGTIDRVAIYPREIVKKSIINSATAVILVHNHPSGDCKPSKDDIEITTKIVKALEVLNIVVHDHLIVTKNDVYSFRQTGLL